MRGDRISGFFGLIFSLVVVIESSRLGVGNLHAPQAGFFPFVAGIALGALSVTLLVSTTPRQQNLTAKREGLSFDTLKISRVFFVAMALFLYPLLLNTLGFILITAVLIGFLLRAVEPQKWYIVITGALSAPLVAYLLFHVFLKVTLPQGFLGF